MREGFNLSYHSGWAMLTVYPQEHRTREVYSDQVANRLKMLGIPPVRMRTIEDIINRSSGKPEKLTPWPEGGQYSAQVQVRLTEDELEAWVVVMPPKPGGEEITRDIIDLALKDAGVTHCILEKELDRIAESALYRRSTLVAQGNEPVQGVAARVLCHFITEKKPFKELRYGRIDLKELNFIQNRKAGDLLAELVGVVPAQDGLTVKGQILPAAAPGEGETLQTGSHVRVEEGKAYAEIDGNVFLDKGVITMEPVVTVDNVDYRTGNIDFEGSVVVKGTVADNFTVKATGDIEAGKCVGRVRLTAGRTLMLRSGVNGDNDALLSSGGDAWIRYIEGASLLCKGNLMVQDSVMHSNLSVWGNMLLSGGRAELIGGSLILLGSLWCRKLGGLYETPTAVILGLSPEVLQEYSRVLLSLNKTRDRLDELDRKMDSMKNSGHKKDEEGNTLEILGNAARRLNDEIGLLQQKQRQIRDENQASERSQLIAEDRIYGGVKISFGFLDHPLSSQGLKQVILRMSHGVVEEHGYNPVEPPQLEE